MEVQNRRQSRYIFFFQSKAEQKVAPLPPSLLSCIPILSTFNPAPLCALSVYSYHLFSRRPFRPHRDGPLLDMNNSSQHQSQLHQQQQQDQHPSPSAAKLEPVVKQEPLQLTSPQQTFAPPQQQHFQPYHGQQQPQSGSQTPSYGGLPGSSAGSMNAFSGLPPNPYSLHNHLLGLSMHGGASPSSAQGLGSPSFGQSAASGIASRGNNSGSTTPSMAHASAPSSPVMNNMQQHQQPFGNGGNAQYSHNGGSSLYHQHAHPAVQHQQHSSQHIYHNQHSSQHQHEQHQHQQHQQHSTQGLSSSNLASGFYPTSPPHQHQQQQYQQTQQTAQHVSHAQFGSVPPAPLRQQQSLQYAPLVPPLTDAQYAQYHQLLGSPFSSAASTPYHSNQSTPYSSMPPSPTLDYQQLADPSQAQKPKRRQVKNACVNCQKACKKCDEGRPCTRCIKYGLADTCVDSTRKVRKKGVKRGPYKRRPPPTQIGSASASTTPTLSHAVLGGPTGPAGYMSEPVTALNSPTQSHMLPFTSSTMSHLSGQIDFGYDAGQGSSNGGGYPFQSSRMENNSYAPPYTTSYSGPGLYSSPYGMTSGHQNGGGANNNNLS